MRLPLLFFGASLALHAFPIVYTVTGTFGRVQNAGTDLLRLSGQPFRIAGTIDSHSVAERAGCQDNCVYPGQRLELTIPGRHFDFHLKDVPVTLAKGRPGTIAIDAKVLWVPLSAVVRANLDWAFPHAAAKERIGASGSTVIYGRGRNRTLLGIENGTFAAIATAPAVSASPESLAFVVEPGRAIPGQTLHLSAAERVECSLAADSQWLALSAHTVYTGDPTGAAISLNPERLSAKERVVSARVTVTCAEAANSPFEIPVSVTVKRRSSSRRRE